MLMIGGVTMTDISIHAPREGCDVAPGAHTVMALEFQSTHPVRGATRKRK